MADISLRLSGLSVTCVSNAFIDNYMAHATGEYVKIYIYLLRCLEQEGEAFSVQKIAAKLGHTDLDVKRAFDYWEQQGMIRQERDAYGELTGICVLDPFTQGYSSTAHMAQQRPITISAGRPVEPAAAPYTEPVTYTEPVYEAPAAPVLLPQPEPLPIYELQSPVDVPVIKEVTSHDLSYYEDDESFSELLFLAETYCGHPLSQKDVDRILFWYDGLNMPAELVEYLITYCADKGHDSLAYMNKIALSWADAGIRTVEDAKSETARHSEIYYTVCTGFGISGRNLTPAEMEYIHRWENMYSDKDIIREALSRTILRTGKAGFGYADRIIRDWYDHGVASVTDIEAYDRSYAAKKGAKKPVGHRMAPKDSFHNFTERDYENWDDIEARLLAKK